jgi:hypothetical protein
MAGLVRHAEARRAPSNGRLLRYRDGHQITERRYDGLWVRIGRELPWVRTQGISTHWIRHTTLTWVERNFGYAVAHAYAGHTDGKGDTGSATTTSGPVRLRGPATPRSRRVWQRSESAARAVASVRPGREEEFAALCTAHGVPATVLGATGGDSLTVDDSFEVPLGETLTHIRGETSDSAKAS